MRFSAIAGAVLATLCAAQTPEGFTPSVTAHLDVIFGSKAVSPPGMSLTKAETAKLPTIGTMTALTGTYVLFVVDLDVPGGTGGARRTLLHGMIQDYKASGQKDTSGVYTLTSSATGPTSYMGPAPPAETPAHPHHYVELLYEQPAGFAVPAAQKSITQSRMGFSMADFAKAANLGPPVAANYFSVTG